MAKRFVYLGITIAFYVVFFNIFRWISNRLPFNGFTDIISLFILIVVNIPLSAICAQKVITIIKKADN